MRIKSYDDLVSYVRDNEDLVCIEMGALRDAHGAGKLGTNVVYNIKQRLESFGLDSFPNELPTDQWKMVMIFRKSSTASDIINAVRSTSQDGVKIVKQFAGRNSDIVDKFRRIQEIVNE